MTDAIRVAIVDDHPMVRQGLRRMLSDVDGVEISMEAAGGLEALEMLTAAPPDLVLLDLVLPDLDGLQVLSEIRRRLPDTKVLIVSALDNDYSIRSAVERDAHGYLPKQATREDIVGAIRTVMGGEVYLPDRMSGARAGRPAPPTLTIRQLEVLKRMSEGASNKEIAQAMGVTPETVKSHVTEILRRLEVRDRTSAVAKALSENLI